MLNNKKSNQIWNFRWLEIVNWSTDMVLNANQNGNVYVRESKNKDFHKWYHK